LNTDISISKKSVRPGISLFFISLLPHIHVEYGRDKAVFSITEGKLLAGNFPTNKTRLVQAWVEIRREELNADWKLAVNGEEVFKIDPLK
jgi:hypothetical protein